MYFSVQDHDEVSEFGDRDRRMASARQDQRALADDFIADPPQDRRPAAERPMPGPPSSQIRPHQQPLTTPPRPPYPDIDGQLTRAHPGPDRT
jgi:hypothetical protein